MHDAGVGLPPDAYLKEYMRQEVKEPLSYHHIGGG